MRNPVSDRAGHSKTSFSLSTCTRVHPPKTHTYHIHSHKTKIFLNDCLTQYYLQQQEKWEPTIWAGEVAQWVVPSGKKQNHVLPKHENQSSDRQNTWEHQAGVEASCGSRTQGADTGAMWLARLVRTGDLASINIVKSDPGRPHTCNCAHIHAYMYTHTPQIHAKKTRQEIG